ncbi:hypothetical protein [Bosea beijingensis]
MPIERLRNGQAAAVRSERCLIGLKSTADMPFGLQAEEWRNSASIPAWPVVVGTAGVLAFRSAYSKGVIALPLSAAGSAPAS